MVLIGSDGSGFELFIGGSRVGILGIEPLAIAAVSPYHFSAMPVAEGLDPAKRKIEKGSYSLIKYSKDVLKNPKIACETKAIALRHLIRIDNSNYLKAGSNELHPFVGWRRQFALNTLRQSLRKTF